MINNVAAKATTASVFTKHCERDLPRARESSLKGTSARGHSAKGRALKSPRNRGWATTRVYLIARGNLMSRTKCT